MVGIIHIHKSMGNLDVNSNASIDDLKADLKNEAVPPPKRKKVNKVSIILEDAESVRLLQFLLKKKPSLKGRLSIANIKGKKSVDKASNLSGQYLEIFADNASKIPELQKVVFVPDADMGWVKNTKNKNVVSLPGEGPIEMQIFKMLKELPENDEFWSKCLGTNYCKQVVIGNNTNLTISNIKEIKKWYRRQKAYWGYGLAIVFEKYYQKYKSKCNDFLDELESAIRRCE